MKIYLNSLSCQLGTLVSFSKGDYFKYFYNQGKGIDADFIDPNLEGVLFLVTGDNWKKADSILFNKGLKSKIAPYQGEPDVDVLDFVPYHPHIGRYMFEIQNRDKFFLETFVSQFNCIEYIKRINSIQENSFNTSVEKVTDLIHDYYENILNSKH